MSNRLTLNLGLRWDLFVPYVEDDDRQSNFDTSTGRFVVASPDARDDGVKVGRYLQTYSKTDFAPRLGFAYDLRGSGRTMLRGGFGMFWNTPLTGTASSKGQNPPFLLAQALTNPLAVRAELELLECERPPTPETGGNSRSSFDPNFRDGYAQQWSAERAAAARHELHGRGRLRRVPGSSARGARRRQPGARAARRDQPERQPAVLRRQPGPGQRGAVAEQGDARLPRAADALREALFGRRLDLSCRTRSARRSTSRRSPTGPRRSPIPTTSATTADRPTTTSRTSSRRPGSTRCRSRAAAHARRMAGERPAAGALRLPVHRVSEPESAVHVDGRRPGPALSSGPDWRRARSTIPTVDRWFDTSAFVPTTEPTATFGNAGRNILRGPGQFTIDAALVKLTTSAGSRPRSAWRHSTC